MRILSNTKRRMVYIEEKFHESKGMLLIEGFVGRVPQIVTSSDCGLGHRNTQILVNFKRLSF